VQAAPDNGAVPDGASDADGAEGNDGAIGVISEKGLARKESVYDGFGHLGKHTRA
jgi:hypothetical protein